MPNPINLMSEGFNLLRNRANADGSVGLGPAPSGYGDEYDRLFASNPYRDLTYNRSFWQTVAHSLGFRTDEDRWREDAQVNAREYDAGIFQMMQQNEYNSPSAQASRMREAGMNPDLLGIGDVAPASTTDPDPNGMSQNVGDEFQRGMSTVSTVAQFAFRAIESTFAILKDSKALKNLQLTNDGLAIQNDNAMISGGNALQELISQVVWKTTSPDVVPDPKQLSGSLDIALGEIFTDPSMRKRAALVAKEFAAGLPQDKDAWKAWYDRASSKAGYASYAGSEGYDEDMSEAMLSFYGFIRDMQNSAFTALKSAEISNANETIEYNDTHDATLEAQSANEGYTADIDIAKQKAQEARITKAINDSFDRWTSALERKANSGERGSMWASIALGLIGLVRLTAMSGMSFSSGRSSFSGVNRATGELTETSRSNFNLGF